MFVSQLQSFCADLEKDTDANALWVPREGAGETFWGKSCPVMVFLGPGVGCHKAQGDQGQYGIKLR